MEKARISFMDLIDLLAILPFYIPYNINIDLRVLRLLRMNRLTPQNALYTFKIPAEIISVQQEKCFHTYGYPRMWLWLKSQNIHRNPKTVLRVMKKYGLLSKIRHRRKWVNLGQQIHKYENLLNRQFQAEPRLV